MADKKLPDKDSFFGGLMNAFATGGRATMSAFQEDLDSIKSGGLPHNAIKAASDVAMAYQNPMMGTMIPKIPSTTTLKDVWDELPELQRVHYYEYAKQLGVDPSKVSTTVFSQPSDVLTKNLPGRAQYDKLVDFLKTMKDDPANRAKKLPYYGPLFGQK